MELSHIYQVRLPHVVSSKEFYGFLRDEDSVFRLRNINAALNNAFVSEEDGFRPDASFVIGGRCACFVDDGDLHWGIWRRVFIESRPKPSEVRCRQIDYGFSQDVPLICLRPLPAPNNDNEVLSAPPMAMQFSLANADKITFDQFEQFLCENSRDVEVKVVGIDEAKNGSCFSHIYIVEVINFNKPCANGLIENNLASVIINGRFITKQPSAFEQLNGQPINFTSENTPVVSIKSILKKKRAAEEPSAGERVELRQRESRSVIEETVIGRRERSKSLGRPNQLVASKSLEKMSSVRKCFLASPGKRAIQFKGQLENPVQKQNPFNRLINYDALSTLAKKPTMTTANHVGEEKHVNILEPITPGELTEPKKYPKEHRPDKNIEFATFKPTFDLCVDGLNEFGETATLYETCTVTAAPSLAEIYIRLSKFDQEYEEFQPKLRFVHSTSKEDNNNYLMYTIPFPALYLNPPQPFKIMLWERKEGKPDEPGLIYRVTVLNQGANEKSLKVKLLDTGEIVDVPMLDLFPVYSCGFYDVVLTRGSFAQKVSIEMPEKVDVGNNGLCGYLLVQLLVGKRFLMAFKNNTSRNVIFRLQGVKEDVATIFAEILSRSTLCKNKARLLSLLDFIGWRAFDIKILDTNDEFCSIGEKIDIFLLNVGNKAKLVQYENDVDMDVNVVITDFRSVKVAKTSSFYDN